MRQGETAPPPTIHLNATIPLPEGIRYTIYKLFKQGEPLNAEDIEALFDITGPQAASIANQLNTDQAVSNALLDTDFWTLLRKQTANPNIRAELIADLANDVNLVEAFRQRPELVEAWEVLLNTGLRTDIPWLTRASSWIEEGGTFVEVEGKIWVKKNGDDIFEIKNEKILPNKKEHYHQGSGGTPIGEPANGYQVYKHGDDLSVRRVPSEAGLSPSNISTLNGGGKGHCLHRHGADVTDDALRKRATEGRAPDGSARTKNNGTETYIPPKSSKFNSPEKVNEALAEVGPGSSKYNAAKSAAESSGANSFPVNHDFGAGSNMGKAYQIPGSQGWYPTSSLPLSGTPQELSGLTKVKAIYVRDGPGDPWYLLTMYPD